MSTTRPYEIKDAKTGEVVLVEGGNPSNALSRLLKDRFIVTTPNAGRVAELLSKGETRYLGTATADVKSGTDTTVTQ